MRRSKRKTGRPGFWARGDGGLGWGLRPDHGQIAGRTGPGIGRGAAGGQTQHQGFRSEHLGVVLFAGMMLAAGD